MAFIFITGLAAICLVLLYVVGGLFGCVFLTGQHQDCKQRNLSHFPWSFVNKIGWVLFLAGIGSLLISLMMLEQNSNWDYGWGMWLIGIALVVWWIDLIIFWMTRHNRLHPIEIKDSNPPQQAGEVWPPPPGKKP